MRNFDSLITLLTLLNQLSKAPASLYIVSAAPALRQKKSEFGNDQTKKLIRFIVQDHIPSFSLYFYVSSIKRKTEHLLFIKSLNLNLTLTPHLNADTVIERAVIMVRARKYR